MKPTYKALLAATLFATAGCTTMQAQIAASGSMGQTDADYATVGNQLVQLDNQEGALAAKKASDPRVVDLASQLTAQAGILNPGFQAALTAAKVTAPTALPPDLSAEVSKLASLSGPAFDHQFVADELAMHKRALAAFQKEDSGTKDGALRNQVETELPAVQSNLDKLTGLSAEYGGTAHS